MYTDTAVLMNITTGMFTVTNSNHYSILHVLAIGTYIQYISKCVQSSLDITEATSLNITEATGLGTLNLMFRVILVIN